MRNAVFGLNSGMRTAVLRPRADTANFFSNRLGEWRPNLALESGAPPGVLRDLTMAQEPFDEKAVFNGGNPFPWKADVTGPLPLASHTPGTRGARRDRESAGTLAEGFRPLTYCDLVSHDFRGHIAVRRFPSNVGRGVLHLAPCCLR